MLKKLLDELLLREDLAEFQNEINEENRIALSMLAYSGILLGIVNLVTQAVVRRSILPPMYSFIMPGFFLLLILADRFLIPQDYSHSTIILYITEALVLGISVALGTVFDPSHQATTILLLLLFLPAFIMDKPLRSTAMLGFWCVVFLVSCWKVKPSYLFRTDAVHILEFYLASIILTQVIMRLRFISLHKEKEARYALEHDSQTGIYSRNALTKYAPKYFGHSILVLIGVMEELIMFSDFYGHDIANELMKLFAEKLVREFGTEDTYRYRGSEFLCVFQGDEQTCLRKIEQIRNELESFTFRDMNVPVTASFGYVNGIPNDSQMMRDMVQLADIYLHQASKKGRNETIGGTFDEQSLRNAIVDSNISLHAESYEINPLTGLPGMSYFTLHATELLNTVVNIERRPMIGYVKLMRMRQFNNKFGYASGDALIADVAKLLVSAFEHRSVSYITAGQFCVMGYKDEAEKGIQEVNDILETYKPGFQIYIIAGFAEYTGSESVISLLDRAKIAENEIRRKKERICFFDAQMEEDNTFRQYIINHVDEAIENEYLKVYYQPIARALTGEVCNEEALSRWQDPKYGFLAPYRFVPLLEDAALMYKVNLYVVSKVLEGFKEREQRGVPICPVSVNLSRSDFEQCDMVAGVTSLVDESGYPHSMIKIEITESAFMDDVELLKREVARFRENGFEVWLDDFGSEYSTLNLLQEIDFDLLKIDMQFMKNFSTTGKNYIIISDIIDMAKRMGITTLIEGIETKEHYEALQRLGCEKIQGYYFNKPNPQEYIIERAVSGTGLKFEDPDASLYYEAIGRIDLHKPSNDPLSSDVEVGNELSTSILEWKDGDFNCLTATATFHRMLVSLGWLSEDLNQTHLKNVPENMNAAAAKCNEIGKRFGISVDHMGRHYTIYLRRISPYEYKGARALLAFIIQNQTA